MKIKILKLVRILITTLMVLTVLAVSVLPAAALPPSITSERYFAPFHMSLRGYVRDANDFSTSYPFLVPLPDFSYYNNTSLPLYSSSSSYAYFEDDDFGIVADVEIHPIDENPSSAQENVVEYIFTLISVDSDLDQLWEFYLQSGFLTKDLTINDIDDGVVFALYELNTVNVRSGEVNGEFYLGNDPYHHYNVSIDAGGAFLSYYQVLYHSDVPFMDMLPRELDRDEWQDYYDSLADADFAYLTSDELIAAQYCFDWVGALFGDFAVSIVSSDLTFDCCYALTDRIVVDRVFETVLEDSAYSSYTGFEKVTHFLGSAVQGFFSVEILPDFSLGSILVVIIAFSLVLWWLKVFAGG